MTVSGGGPHVDGGAEPTESSTLSLDDGDIHVCQDGPRDAPALLLVHGSASSTRSWDPLVPMLTGSHHVIRIDLLGHGRSAEPADRSYALPDQARRADAALDRLGVEHAVVVGHSSGGVAATALAEQRPDLVTALALIDIGPGLDAFIAPQSAAPGLPQWPPTDEQLRRMASTAVSRAGHRIPPELLEDVRRMTLHTFTATMRATRAYLEQRVLPDRLAALGTPLLVIFGEDDRRWRSSSAADYHAVPGAKVELLPGLGHSPMLEDPPRTDGHPSAGLHHEPRRTSRTDGPTDVLQADRTTPYGRTERRRTGGLNDAERTDLVTPNGRTERQGGTPCGFSSPVPASPARCSRTGSPDTASPSPS
ncbi:alpha/beta fold hydrolase [Streptomyces sp. PD-S100-1]|uniref:alpha/beta fold hydrolase n=1 Tax=Streptomyces sp. PD-S100-1 TaxID=3394351 RepID=UPI0039BC47EB